MLDFSNFEKVSPESFLMLNAIAVVYEQRRTKRQLKAVI